MSERVEFWALKCGGGWWNNDSVHVPSPPQMFESAEDAEREWHDETSKNNPMPEMHHFREVLPGDPDPDEEKEFITAVDIVLKELAVRALNHFLGQPHNP